MFNRRKAGPKDPNAIEPTKLNSSKVIMNKVSGESKKVTKEMAAAFKANPYNTEFNIILDSELEARYYRDELLPMINDGQILVEFQPKFTILPKMEKEGTKHMAVTYTPDFKITYFSGKTIYVDVKGMLDQVFPIKRKMFDAAFPEFSPLVVMKYWKARGGWMTLEQFDAFKKADKKALKLAAGG